MPPVTSTPSRSSSSPSPKSTASTEPSQIRSFIADDAEQVAALWQRCFRHQLAPPPAGLKQYFIDLFLHHPWYDPEIASLVLERRGEIVGFGGRMARPMVFRGRPIRCAVATQLMVHPERKLGFAAIELVRAMFNGPQDLVYSDGANNESCRLWQRCGGEASRLLSFEWTRRLRPAHSFTLGLRDHTRFGSVASLASPVSGAFDALAVRLLPRLYHKPCRSLIHCQPATAQQILPLFEQVASSASLRCHYDAAGLAWVLDQTAHTQSFGRLRTMLVLDAQNSPIGWFIYLVQPGEVAYILQLGAAFGRARDVLSALFRDAWEQDAVSVTGQLDPAMLTELSNSHCQFRCTEMGVLMHSNNPDLLNAIHRGDTFLSRLDGEWFLRFGIDRNAKW